ncbi:MAG: hypothetical protein Q9217_000175 [Psora testacea]
MATQDSAAQFQNFGTKKKALESENFILHQRLFEAGQVNQTNEARIRSFNTQSEEVTRLQETVSNYQRAFATQQESLEYKKREHALAAQSLAQEVKYHKATTRSLEQERAYIRDFITFLDTLDVSKRAEPSDNTSIGTLWLERDSMKTSLDQLNANAKSLEETLKDTRDELEHKRLLLEHLSGNLRVEPGSTSVLFDSKSGEEGNETMMPLREASSPRKRVRT